MKRLKQQEFKLIIEILIETKDNPAVKRTIPLNAITLRIPLS